MKIQEAIQRLSKPLNIEQIDWRVATISEKNGKAGMSVLGYKDARVDMERLDEVLKGCWSPSYQRDSKGVLQCTISIYVEMPDGTWQWVNKTSNGVESYTEKAKGEYSDAFKRAGFMLGIGRELYELPFIYITLSGNEYTTYKGKPRPKFGYNPNDFTWGRDEKGLLFCKDSKGKIRFKEKVSSLRVSKTNEIENTESKIQKPTPKKKTTKHPVKDLDKVKSGLEKSKDATLAQLKKQFVLTKAQANELVKSKLVTKEEIADVVEK